LLSRDWAKGRSLQTVAREQLASLEVGALLQRLRSVE